VSVNRRVAGEPHRCAPVEGEIVCVEARRLDRSKVHEHFGPDEYRKAVAREKAIKAEAAAPAGPSAPKATSTFEGYAELWRSAQRTAEPKAMRNALRRAYPIIGPLELTAIDGLQLKALQTTLLGVNAHSTVAVTMSHVKRIMRQAAADGRVPRDPTVGVKMPRRDTLDAGGVVTEHDVTTHAESLAIMAAAPARGRLGVILGFGCGMRIGEILAVTPDQHTARKLRPDLLRIDFQETDRGRVGPKTRRGVRTIELPDVAAAEMRRAVKGQAADALLFRGPKGGRPNRGSFYDQVWYPALIGADLLEDRPDGPGQREGAYNFHVTRHYAASAMLGRGVTVEEVAAYLGDAVVTISTVYAHWLRDAPGLAKGALDAALGPVPPPAAEDEADEAGGAGGAP